MYKFKNILSFSLIFILLSVVTEINFRITAEDVVFETGPLIWTSGAQEISPTTSPKNPPYPIFGQITFTYHCRHSVKRWTKMILLQERQRGSDRGRGVTGRRGSQPSSLAQNSIPRPRRGSVGTHTTERERASKSSTSPHHHHPTTTTTNYF